MRKYLCHKTRGQFLVVGLLLSIVLSHRVVHSAPLNLKSIINCASFLNKQPELKFDTIIGRIDINSQAWGTDEASFHDYLAISNSRQTAGGDHLVGLLSNHLDPKSPTVNRVEEKAVVAKARLDEFLVTTQSEVIAQERALGSAIHWQMRDQAPEGMAFKTITEYGSTLSFNIKESKSSFILKPRFRKYYSFLQGSPDKADDFDPVMGELVALELKMTSLSGLNDGSLLSLRDTVFKPRVMITDQMADELKMLSGSIEQRLYKLSLIKLEAMKLKNSEGNDLNDMREVRSFFEALSYLIQEQPDFLNPIFAVSYERESYKTYVNGKEYQFTADQNVQIYKAVGGLKSSSMSKYFEETSRFHSRPNEVFIELKSPISEKNSNSPVYAMLNGELEKGQISSYKRGGGKYSVAANIDKDLQDKHMDQTLFEKGTEFWLIKGAANLDALSKDKNIIQRSSVEVAQFFRANEKNYQIVFSYEPKKQPDGTSLGTIRKIKVFDERGFSVKLDPKATDAIASIKNKDPNLVMGIEVEGTIIPFKATLSDDDIEFHKNFFEKYYRHDKKAFGGKFRNLSKEVAKIKTKWGMNLFRFKLRASNRILWAFDRSEKGTFNAVFIGAAGAGIAFLTGHLLFAEVPNPVTQSVTPIQIERRVEPIQQQEYVIRGLSHENIGQVYLYAATDPMTSEPVFTLPAELLSEIKDQKIYLTNKDGVEIQFVVSPDLTHMRLASNN